MNVVNALEIARPGAVPRRRRQRRVLLLQGPASWFFLRLARALEAQGAEVRRVLLCPGDRLFWRGPAIAYRGRAEEWAGWLGTLLAAERVTDLVCLGDGRRWHREALALAEDAGIRTHVVEQGYLRPGWLTVEPGGTGGRSRLPRDWAEIRRRALGPQPPEPSPWPAPFWNYAAMDVAWNLANLVAAPLAFPHYRGHALDPPLRDWAGWALKAAAAPAAALGARRVARRLAAEPGPVFLLPLQLETDYQIRDHAPAPMAVLLERVVAAFAAHAPHDARLVVKRHPLDNGLAGWRGRLRRAAEREGCSGRCLFLAGGDLGRLLSRADGVVTVNSTVGLAALRASRPVIALGRAVYDLPGLAAQDGLAAFFRSPEPPDPARVAEFVAMLRASVQVPGTFDGRGAEPGARNLARRILAGPG